MLLTHPFQPWELGFGVSVCQMTPDSMWIRPCLISLTSSLCQTLCSTFNIPSRLPGASLVYPVGEESSLMGGKAPSWEAGWGPGPSTHTAWVFFDTCERDRLLKWGAFGGYPGCPRKELCSRGPTPTSPSQEGKTRSRPYAHVWEITSPNSQVPHHRLPLGLLWLTPHLFWGLHSTLPWECPPLPYSQIWPLFNAHLMAVSCCKFSLSAPPDLHPLSWHVCLTFICTCLPSQAGFIFLEVLCLCIGRGLGKTTFWGAWVPQGNATQ